MLITKPADLGALIKDARNKYGYSQADLAKRIGVSRFWVANLEKGKSGAAIAKVFKALRVLHLTLEANEAPNGQFKKSFKTDYLTSNYNKLAPVTQDTYLTRWVDLEQLLESNQTKLLTDHKKKVK